MLIGALIGLFISAAFVLLCNPHGRYEPQHINEKRAMIRLICTVVGLTDLGIIIGYFVA